MTGEKNLEKLLATMSPTLRPEAFVFCSFAETDYGDHSRLEPFAAVKEDEGLTLIIPKSKADENNIEYRSVFRCITLNVHSSLDAIGLTAVISTRLAKYDISANVIAGFYHDHIFVQDELADKAIAAINELTRK